MGEVVIVPYDPRWPQRFELIATKLRQWMGPLALSVDHIGSTSVPGLASKDRVDVQVSIESISPDFKERLDQALMAGGFQASRFADDHRPPGDDAPDEHWKKFFARGAHAELPFSANIHLRVRGRRNYAYALLFRDYLRASPNSAKAYEILKLKLAAHIDTTDLYSDIKDPVCDIIMVEARTWAARTDWHAPDAG